jgi:hypothetical protein
VKEFSNQSHSGRSNQIGVKFVKWCIQTLWERSGKSCKAQGKKDLRPCAIVHIDANVLPDDILPQLDAPMHNKMYFIYTGQTPLEHPDELELIDQMLDDAVKLHEYLPVLLSMGLDAFLPRITQVQLTDISDVLANPKDKRQGQIILQYDIIFKACQDAITRFSLDTPPRFSSGDIDRTALIYFNHPQEVKQPT